MKPFRSASGQRFAAIEKPAFGYARARPGANGCFRILTENFVSAINT
jgi:hypothetical protein